MPALGLAASPASAGNAGGSRSGIVPGPVRWQVPGVGHESRHARGTAKPRTTVREVFVIEAPQFSWVWSSIQSLVRVHVRRVDGDVVVHEEDRFYISSLSPQRLTGEQWLSVTRGHWSVENHNHWTLDAMFHEDEKPWFPSSLGGRWW